MPPQSQTPGRGWAPPTYGPGRSQQPPAPDAAAPPCVGPQEDLFFAQDAHGVARAKELCAACPGRMPCLAGALARREPWGVWGGELFQGGAVVTRRRPRGRPRKARPVDDASR